MNTPEPKKVANLNLDSFLEDLMAHMVEQHMPELYKDPLASAEFKKDVEDLFSWLEQDIGMLTYASKQKVKKAYRAYLLLCPAPSFDLEKTFEFYKSKHSEYKARADELPPKNIQNVFNRMLATDDEIALKINKSVVNNKRGATWREQFLRLSELDKFIAISSASWIVWTIIRTNFSFQLIGIDFYDMWDEDMLIQNIVIVPACLLVGKYLLKYYQKK